MPSQKIAQGRVVPFGGGFSQHPDEPSVHLTYDLGLGQLALALGHLKFEVGEPDLEGCPSDEGAKTGQGQGEGQTVEQLGRGSHSGR
ncbi:MAG: hypothetical protein NZM40_00955 [Sphingomonadaceae bacterium]|uniref:hypothetical protein n=1 Tax=Thermaurantiacus sp. TaxID=2820283 RepID=UPI00298F17BF|nr:hypothetical protein [Thermaurantiacus sp.]MCS6986010.1 hypothetical protein [Sphingomonadaceae bacterium]